MPNKKAEEGALHEELVGADASLCPYSLLAQLNPFYPPLHSSISSITYVYIIAPNLGNTFPGPVHPTHSKPNPAGVSAAEAAAAAALRTESCCCRRPGAAVAATAAAPFTEWPTFMYTSRVKHCIFTVLPINEINLRSPGQNRALQPFCEPHPRPHILDFHRFSQPLRLPSPAHHPLILIGRMRAHKK